MIEVTVFKSMSEHATPEFYNIYDVLDRIKRGKNKPLVDRIRAEPDKIKRDRLKKQLLWICFSGKFLKRLNDAMLSHSGLICLDFDNIPTDKELKSVRATIDSNPHTFSSFISPSGKGIKALVKVPVCANNKEHNRRFDALAETYKENKYFDKNVKGVVRVCFESYDPNIYINKDSKLFTGIAEQQAVTKTEYNGDITSDNLEIFSRLVQGEINAGRLNLRKGDRNRSVYKLSCACVDYIPSREDAKSLILKYLLDNGALSADFTEIEILETIDSAYAHIVSKNKVMKISAGADSPIKQNSDLVLPDDGISFDDEPVSDKKESPVPDNVQFWRWKKTDYVIDFLALKKWLHDCGFYRYEISTKDFVFVRIVENTVEEIDIRHIKEFVLNYLESIGEDQIYNMVAGNTKFKKEYINYLDPIKITWNNDGFLDGWVYYSNTAVRVTREGVECIPYIDLDGFIWKSQKLDREFSPLAPDAYQKCDFAGFIFNVSNKDDGRILAFKTGIGYLMHGFKDMSVMPAVIFNDEIISNEPCGGSGKGLTMKCLGEMKNTVFFDGKNFSMNKSFVFQRVNLDTQIMVFDDVKKNFAFEKLFSIITDGISVEKKNQTEVYMSFKNSPKVVITTNHVIKGDSTSHSRRKFELELHPHYTEDYQPIDDFGRAFIDGWDEDEYLRFDNFMLGCLHLYLQKGLIRPKYKNLSLKRIIGTTSEDFFEFARANFTHGKKYRKMEWFTKFEKEYRVREYPTPRAFYDWMRKWAEYNKWEVADTGGGRSFIEFREEYDEGVTEVPIDDIGDGYVSLDNRMEIKAENKADIAETKNLTLNI